MMMRQGIAVMAAAGLVAAPVSLAAKAAKSPKGTFAVTLTAAPSPVTFSRVSTLSGVLSGPGVAGVTVRLEQDSTLPLGDKFSPAGMTTATTANGAYAFAVRPGVNTQYRVMAQTSPNTPSPARLVRVRPLVGLGLSDATPARGTRVRFSGSVRPAHDGTPVSIQRRSATGRWVTLTHAVLRDAGTTRSVYRRSVRIRSSGAYRVKIAAHADHANGISRIRVITVH